MAGWGLRAVWNRPWRVVRAHAETLAPTVICTILLPALAAIAAAGTPLGSRVGLRFSLACAGVGVVTAGMAWSSPTRRAGAGRVRHALVTIAGITCLALVACDVLRLLPESA